MQSRKPERKEARKNTERRERVSNVALSLLSFFAFVFPL